MSTPKPQPEQREIDETSYITTTKRTDREQVGEQPTETVYESVIVFWPNKR